MRSIDLDRPIRYVNASFRYFEPGEHHSTRVWGEDVLLLVFDGVLRFFEEDEEIVLTAGEYYIQQRGLYQAGVHASDEPRYLYVHFEAEWRACAHALPCRGRFDPTALGERMAALDRAQHEGAPLTEKAQLFFSLLLSLRERKAVDPVADAMAAHVRAHMSEPFSLSALASAFHYSENYVIRLFKRAFGATPVAYLNAERLRRATELLEQTSRPVAEIAASVGFGDYAYFFRLFKRRTGRSPLAFRASLRTAEKS